MFAFTWLRSFLALVSGVSVLVAGGAASAQDIGVKVSNETQPVLCAEEDNVTVTMAAPNVRRFRIEAAHPTYLSAITNDNWAADWTACNFGPPAEAAVAAAAKPVVPPKPPRPPERITLFERVDRWLVGLKFPNFWRPATATVEVEGRIFKGLHLLQLWVVRPNGGEEVLVLYPQDGYWRARPRAPKGRDLTAFGSSFLIGPVERDGRPLVRLSKIIYRPNPEAFELTFTAGGAATVRVAEKSARRTALEVTFDAPVSGRPFAALRSMYVTEFNNDVARIAARAKGARGWTENSIMDFKGTEATSLWLGRTTPSRHNTSSPDMVFSRFQAKP